jgi:dihydroorotate dehydrogenase electron transfer subunit
MVQELAPVRHCTQVADNIYTLSFESPRIALATRAGQFVNILPGTSFDPLLRRAYSVHRVDGHYAEIIFNVVGKGSALLASMTSGMKINVLGPLGVPFHCDGDYDRAILVSGGVGIAPMPILGDELVRRGKEVINIHGARSAAMIVDDGRLMNVRYATDDGSMGARGNVVDLLADTTNTLPDRATRIFACGPNAMLIALGRFCNARQLPLEVSLECQMACGIGICQGCPVEMKTGDRKYSLVCTHGPNYDFNDVAIESIPSLH